MNWNFGKKETDGSFTAREMQEIIYDKNQVN